MYLGIMDIRVERIQEISEEDAIAEGCQVSPGLASARQMFMLLWDKLHAKAGHSWEQND